jgi:hypothetical protein
MRPCLWLACCAAMMAAEPPSVPDPYGLGERLALIEHLREAYGLRPEPGSDLETLRAAYASAWAARQRPADEDAGRPDRERRLRARIAERHGVEPEAGLDEAALQVLLRRLDAERAARAAADIAELAARDAAAPRRPTDAADRPAADAPAHVPDPAAAARAPAAPASAAVRVLPFAAPGVTGCYLATAGERAALLVVFGTDHNGAFADIPEASAATMLAAPHFRRGVLLLGHGAGTAINSEPIARHLAAHKAFYETMGGTAPAAPVECLVFAACAGGGQAQMAAMREGLGYWPTWRVASGDNAFTTRLNVVAALQAVAARPAEPAWRGMFRLRMGGAEIVSFGDVGVGGERAETSFYRIVPAESGGWRVEEQR